MTKGDTKPEPWGVGDGPVFDARTVKSTTIPYISTDRADLQRILEHSDRIRKHLEATPTSSARVTTAQWQALTKELYAFLALTRRIKERLANG